MVAIAGEIDLSNTDEVASQIEAAVTSDSTSVVVDLTETTYLDSAGVRLLLTLAGRLQGRRQQLRLTIPDGSPIRVVLDIAGLASVIPIDPA